MSSLHHAPAMCSHRCSCDMQNEINRLEATVAEQESKLVALRHRVRDLEGQLQYERMTQTPEKTLMREQLLTPDRDDVRPRKRHQDLSQDPRHHALKAGLQELATNGNHQFENESRRYYENRPLEHRPHEHRPQEPLPNRQLMGYSAMPAHQSTRDLTTTSAPPGTVLGSPEAVAATEAPLVALTSKPTRRKQASSGQCISCKTTSSSCWRGSWGAGKLCNSCGLKYSKTRAYCSGCSRVAAKSNRTEPGSECPCGGVFLSTA